MGYRRLPQKNGPLRPIRKVDWAKTLTQYYMDMIVRLHGVPVR